LSLGIFPASLSMTEDQVELLRQDNVVSDEAKGGGRTLESLGLRPRAIKEIVPSYLRGKNTRALDGPLEGA
jgi:hypothetical protein